MEHDKRDGDGGLTYDLRLMTVDDFDGCHRGGGKRKRGQAMDGNKRERGNIDIILKGTSRCIPPRETSLFQLDILEMQEPALLEERVYRQTSATSFQRQKHCRCRENHV